MDYQWIARLQLMTPNIKLLFPQKLNLTLYIGTQVIQTKLNILQMDNNQTKHYIFFLVYLIYSNYVNKNLSFNLYVGMAKISKFHENLQPKIKYHNRLSLYLKRSINNKKLNNYSIQVNIELLSSAEQTSPSLVFCSFCFFIINKHLITWFSILI